MGGPLAAPSEGDALSRLHVDVQPDYARMDRCLHEEGLCYSIKNRLVCFRVTCATPVQVRASVRNVLAGIECLAKDCLSW